MFEEWKVGNKWCFCLSTRFEWHLHKFNVYWIVSSVFFFLFGVGIWRLMLALYRWFVFDLQKEKSTFEVLETLEEKIRDIQDFSVSTQQRQKRFIGTFLLVSIGFYIICSVIFYFAFFPPTLQKRIIYSTPLLIFPFLWVYIELNIVVFGFTSHSGRIFDRVFNSVCFGMISGSCCVNHYSAGFSKEKSVEIRLN